MRILSIMTKEFKENFANRQVMLLMILFPIVIIAILGFAFSNNFNTNFKFQDIKVIFTDELFALYHFFNFYHLFIAVFSLY